jgi:hypothetical protein
MDYFQLFWTPDIIIHDLVSFNKPEILNQVCYLKSINLDFDTINPYQLYTSVVPSLM